MPGRQRSHAAAARAARLVFDGTVRKPAHGAAKSVLVAIDSVIEAPADLADLAGHEATVQFARAVKLAAGQRAIFYTDGRAYGDSIVVHALDYEPIAPGRPMVSAQAAAGPDPVTKHRIKRAEARMKQAAVVASGRVVSVSLPGEAGRAAGRARARARATVRASALPSAAEAAVVEEPLSEHAPLWRDASIELTEVHKGTEPGARVTVRFPSSTDVMWYRAPKFHVGQEGLFMLHQGEADGAKRRGITAAAVPEKVYTALDPADFQSFDQTNGVHHAVVASIRSADRTTRESDETPA